jgi:FSR family fosmidomycin resistance protein-like MFS transporter
VRIAAFAHGSHDLYPSFLGPLVPQIQDKLGISLALASLMLPAQQLPSVFQPVIGYMADRTSRRWFVVLSPGIAAVSLSSLGLAPNLAVVLLLLLVSGLASATFHAPAVALVGEYGGNRMGRAMSIFMAGGEISRTIGPILITGAIALFTLEGSFVVMVFGLSASVILYFTLDTRATDAARLSAPKIDLRPLLRARRKPIIGIIGFTITTGIAAMPFTFFLVEYLVEKGHSEWYGGFALSTIFAAGIIGGLIGGSLSDRYGRQWVLTLSVSLAPPLLYIYLLLEDGSIGVLAMLLFAGMITMSSRSVSLAVASEILPEARGPMAGLLLALGFVTTSLAALAFGILADTYGIEQVFWYMPAIWVTALPFLFLLPRRASATNRTA